MDLKAVISYFLLYMVFKFRRNGIAQPGLWEPGYKLMKYTYEFWSKALEYYSLCDDELNEISSREGAKKLSFLSELIW